MAIITIYQGASGSGEELAQAIAQSLGSSKPLRGS
jgi:ketol-acid reductoisomerase